MGTAKRQRKRAGRQARLAQLEAQRRKQRQRRLAIRVAILVVAFVALAFVFAQIFGDDDDETGVAAGDTTIATETSVGSETTAASDTTAGSEAAEFTYGTGECPPPEGVTEPVREFADAPQQCIDPAKSYVAVFDTTEGVIRVQLDTERTPGTTNNFVVLARYRYYDGTRIFRTDPSIGIIQAGGEGPADPGPGYTIPDEGGSFTYEPGQLVMARTAAPDSAGAQFFFVAEDSASALDSQGTYVVFGNVIEGLDVVKGILALHEDEPGNQLGGRPSRDVTINSVTIEET